MFNSTSNSTLEHLRKAFAIKDKCIVKGLVLV